MAESYLVGLRATHYHLPYGVYAPAAQDSRGIYYKAPVPIKVTGLFAPESGLAEGGIYVPSSSSGRAVGLWFYLLDDDGSVLNADPIPGGLSWDEGDSWRIEQVDAADAPAA